MGNKFLALRKSEVAWAVLSVTGTSLFWAIKERKIHGCNLLLRSCNHILVVRYLKKLYLGGKGGAGYDIWRKNSKVEKRIRTVPGRVILSVRSFPAGHQ
ncbi:hypothetical protein D7X98_16760 [bacterium 1XD8-76]|nr:hypothetical protein D7X98_16760 [bacterium 1XD8-76]